MRSKILKHLPKAARRDLGQLAQTVRAARIAKGLTQADLAARLEISPVTVRAVERGDPAVAVGIWMAILWVLGAGSLSSATGPTDGNANRAIPTRQRARARARDKPIDDF